MNLESLRLGCEARSVRDVKPIVQECEAQIYPLFLKP